MFEEKDYIIQISKLKNGENIYNLHLNKELFEKFDCKDAEDLSCELSMRIVKNERLIEIYFSFEGTMSLMCSRCLSKVEFPIKKESVLYVKFGEEYSEPDINERIIPENENDIDLLSFIYEELRLEIPISPMHESEKDCDRKMIEILEAINDRKIEEKEDFDPRWAKLKELK